MVHVGDFDTASSSSISDDAFHNAVNAYMPDLSPTPTTTGGGQRPPIPADVGIGTGAGLSRTFPRTFTLDDNKSYDLQNIYYRMRDKACQRICDAATIQNVPSQFVRASKQSDTGCEYSLKIMNNKEMYFYTSNDGQNCYDATEKMINAHGKDKDAVWINGPSPYEFYQIGIRDINTGGSGGASHEPFPDDDQHLE